MIEKRFRADELTTKSRHIEGYAVIFDSWSEDLGFREIIHPGAITPELIQESDVLCKFNHNDEKVLARSKYGKGSLKLEVDSRGLKYSFDAPETALGDELLVYLDRGDVCSSSFAFRMDEKDPYAQKWTQKDGVLYREIFKISGLYDVSPVFTPAYEETSVFTRMKEIQDKVNTELDILKVSLDGAKDDLVSRGLEIINLAKTELRMLTDEEKLEFERLQKKMLEDQETLEEVKEMVNPDEEETTDAPEERSDDEEKETPNDETPEEKEEEPQGDDEETPKEEKEDLPEEKRFINTNTNKTIMNYSILSALRSKVEGRSNTILDEVNKIGAEEMRKAGVNLTGNGIYIPANETRANVTVAAEGTDIVEVDFHDILEPLYAKNVLVQAGATFIPGLVGDYQVPVMTAGNVYWEGETTAAKDAAPAFSNVKLQPKRLAAYVNVSKQLLNQDSLGAENKIRQDLINAINAKLEATILSANDGTAGPKGMLDGENPVAVASFADLLGIEATVEAANVFGDCKYIVTPAAKAKLRAMAKSTKSTQLVMENNEIDGIQALSTGHLTGAGLIYGDFSQLVIGQWGGIELTVDPYTQIGNGMIRLVVNAYFDFKKVRPEAFGYATV